MGNILLQRFTSHNGSLSECHALAGSDQQNGGVTFEDGKVATLFEVIMPLHHFKYRNV